MLKKMAALLLAISMLCALTGCTTWNNFKAAFIDPPVPVEPDKPVIKIGVLEPFTGADAAAAADEVLGIEIAHELYGQINGVDIELVYADNQSNIEFCGDAAQSLIDAGVSVILGSYKSVLTLASSDVIKEAKIPAITITNTNPIITQTNPYYFRVTYIDSFEGDVAADFVYSQLQTKNTVVFMKEGFDYANVLAEEYISEFEAITGESDFITVVSYAPDTVDFTPYFERLGRLNPDVIFYPSTQSVAQPIIQAAKDAGYNYKWIGTKNWDGLEMEDIYYTLDYDPNLPTTERAFRFKKAYAEIKGADATPSDATALGFDAYILALSGLWKAEDITSGDSICDAMSVLEDIECATGYLTMSTSGDPIKEVVVEHYIDGTRTVVYTVTPSKEGRE
ncbi:MAG: ABC transporter substrate-binding protein [Clostridia bacterium]|nr:ABC transporter substrate-binding protein [Clostridia bacterium]